MTYSVFDYCSMIADRPRVEAFHAALEQTVRPGDVVLDIGTGTGLFALLALRHGARKVYAIEPNPAIHVARRLAAANGATDRIEFFEALSTEVELPERANVIVSDIRGAMPLFPGHIPAIVDARDRHLADGGRLVPLRDTLRVVPVANAEAWDHYVGRWRGLHFDLETAPLDVLLANTLHSGRPAGVQPLAPPRTWGTIEYEQVTGPNFHGTAHWTLDAPGTLHGYHLWFDMELADGISITNAPDEPSLIYGSMFLALPEPVTVRPGERLTVRLLADLVGEEYLWRWETALEHGEGAPTHVRQSTMSGALPSMEELRLREAGHEPCVGVEAALDHEILTALRAATPLGEIARSVADRYRTRFPDWHGALAHVSDLYLRYARRPSSRSQADAPDGP